MAFFRAFLFAAALAVLFAIIASLQGFFSRRHPSLARWVSIAFCRSLLAILRVSVEVRGTVASEGPVLLSANHMSWIDILALGSVMPFCFLAKREVASWPFLSRFATVQGTVFVDRSRRRDILAVNAAMAERMLAGRKVLLFPEGTTFGADGPGRFLSSHFAAARHLLRVAPGVAAVAVQPTALAYSSPIAAWLGDETLVPHLWRVLRAEPIRCTLVFGTPLPYSAGSDRKAIAAAARDAVVGLLADLRVIPAPLIPSPDGLRGRGALTGGGTRA